MADDLVTGPELARFQTLILDRIDSGFGQVNARLDKVNSRLDKHDDAIGALTQHGCGQFAAHREVLAALDAPETLARWHPAVKVGGIGGAAVALFEFGRVVIERIWK